MASARPTAAVLSVRKVLIKSRELSFPNSGGIPAAFKFAAISSTLNFWVLELVVLTFFPLLYGNDSRLLIKTLRTLAQGKPVTKAETAQISEELEIPFEQADEFLRGITERDSSDSPIKPMILSSESLSVMPR